MQPRTTRDTLHQRLLFPPTASDVRNFVADLDDRDEATPHERDMLRQVAHRLEELEALVQHLQVQLTLKGN
jgi:hypothetical protein